MKARFTDEECEALAEMSSDLRSALTKHMDEVMASIERNLLTYNLDGGTESKLIQLKAQCEGAAKAITALKARIQPVKKPN